MLLAIGRRGTPRKLNVPGEETEKVAYRLLEPEQIHDEHILVVGGGDSAVEAALQLCEHNQVVLSYRKEAFSRIKPRNNEKIMEAMNQSRLEVRFNTSLRSIDKKQVLLTNGGTGDQRIQNDRVYIFAGGELPTQFLNKIGIQITKKFGEAILKHN